MLALSLVYGAGDGLFDISSRLFSSGYSLLGSPFDISHSLFSGSPCHSSRFFSSGYCPLGSPFDISHSLFSSSPCHSSRLFSSGYCPLGSLFDLILADTAAGEGGGKDEEQCQNPVVFGHGLSIGGRMLKGFRKRRAGRKGAEEEIRREEGRRPMVICPPGPDRSNHFFALFAASIPSAIHIASSGLSALRIPSTFQSPRSMTTLPIFRARAISERVP